MQPALARRRREQAILDEPDLLARHLGERLGRQSHGITCTIPRRRRGETPRLVTNAKGGLELLLALEAHAGLPRTCTGPAEARSPGSSE